MREPGCIQTTKWRECLVKKAENEKEIVFTTVGCTAWLGFAFWVSFAYYFVFPFHLPPSLGQNQEVPGKVGVVVASFPEHSHSLPSSLLQGQLKRFLPLSWKKTLVFVLKSHFYSINEQIIGFPPATSSHLHSLHLDMDVFRHPGSTFLKVFSDSL